MSLGFRLYPRGASRRQPVSDLSHHRCFCPSPSPFPSPSLDPSPPTLPSPLLFSQTSMQIYSKRERERERLLSRNTEQLGEAGRWVWRCVRRRRVLAEPRGKDLVFVPRPWKTPRVAWAPARARIRPGVALLPTQLPWGPRTPVHLHLTLQAHKQLLDCPSTRPPCPPRPSVEPPDTGKAGREGTSSASAQSRARPPALRLLGLLAAGSQTHSLHQRLTAMAWLIVRASWRCLGWNGTG